MIDPNTITSLAEGLPTTEGSSLGDQQPSLATAADQARFQSAMQTTDEEGPGVGSELAIESLEAVATPAVQNSAGEQSAGDKILQGVDKLRGAVTDLPSDLGALFRQADQSPAELLALKLKADQMSIAAQASAGATGKVHQDLNSLLKGQ